MIGCDSAAVLLMVFALSLALISTPFSSFRSSSFRICVIILHLH